MQRFTQVAYYRISPEETLKRLEETYLAKDPAAASRSRAAANPLHCPHVPLQLHPRKKVSLTGATYTYDDKAQNFRVNPH